MSSTDTWQRKSTTSKHYDDDGCAENIFPIYLYENYNKEI